MVRPLTETNTLRAERQEARRKARMAQVIGVDEHREDQLLRTGADLMAADYALKAEPMTSCTSSGICSDRPLLVAADTTAEATTCWSGQESRQGATPRRRFRQAQFQLR